MKLKTWKRLLTTAAVAAALTLKATVGAYEIGKDSWRVIVCMLV